MKKHIFDKAKDCAKCFNELQSIKIFKSNEHCWTKEAAEVATDDMPEYIIFTIGLDIEQEDDSGKILTGSITEIWFWDEEHCPFPVIYPNLSEWKVGTSVEIHFYDLNGEFDGEMKKI